MINRLVFLSRKQVEHYVATGNNVAISIRDPNRSAPRLHHSIQGRIYLEFDDDTEYSVGLSPDQVPDLMLGHENGRRIMVNGNELCDYNDANKMLRFIQRAIDSEDALEMIIHCEMGISRSAAVAQYIHERYGVPISNGITNTDRLNKRVFRLLNKAADGLPPSIGNLPEDFLMMKKTHRHQ
ncbi:MAG: hypothetical protein CTY35_01955 [Methylotenera sp.]|uniref:hypothetical protein n=1 Tax=Methylotenera sp. TaxID=2051956 RepID=UPI000D462E8C|nr:hypothetical protein [Methylotenera sp.]PPC84394.1 MAG: hypothetical protein CTY38_02175 [Methylotenera sp.]PPD01036.1 MAG: hypothetical protein CTY35_01955 [Methylotenera sp.]